MDNRPATTMTTSHKRKWSIADDGTEREIKHRSSKACQSCRARKVRCDVLTNGDRCTNCRLDHLECTVAPSRRGRAKNSTRGNTTSNAQRQPIRPAEGMPNHSPVADRNGSSAQYEDAASFEGSPSAGRVPVTVTFEQDSGHEKGGSRPVNDNGSRLGAQSVLSGSHDGMLPSEKAFSTTPQSSSIRVKSALPSFIVPLEDRISSDDLEYLMKKGATIVPEPELIWEIFESYMFSVHPFMPMLDYRSFVRALLKPEDDSRVSLLLFQAVMFAGLHSLSRSAIQRLGFQSAKEARRVFFDRARLLYDLDVEFDTAAVVQSLILMSLMYSKWHERRHTWHWTGLAYDAARSIGLHREPMTRNLPDTARRFRRRLWWSLYIRDRMIALGTRRPMRIQDHDFSVTMLSMEDFDMESLDGISQAQPVLLGVEEMRSAALMCIELTKLCQCIGPVVTSQYTTLSDQPDVSCTTMVVPRQREDSNGEVERCEKELEDWHGELNSNIAKTNGTHSSRDPNSCSEVHWAVLNLTYWTAINVLHRPQALQSHEDGSDNQTTSQRSRNRVKESARNLTKLSQNMLNHDQLRFLSPVGVTALIAASLTHLLDVSSDDEDVRDASTFRLHQSLRGLKALSEAYGSADAAVSFLTAVCRKAGIFLPDSSSAGPGQSSSVPITRESSVRRSVKPSSIRNDRTSMSDDRSSYVAARNSARNGHLETTHSYTAAQQAEDLQQAQTRLWRPAQTTNAYSASRSNRPMQIISDFDGDNPTAVEVPPPVTHTSTAIPEHDHTGLATDFADVPSHASFLDWSHGLDAGMDFETMALSYGFQSNAFSFLDGPLSGV